jgi:hypothetical protein
MRPKARGLAQHGGPPGWLEESDPAGCDFVCDGRSMPPALTGADLLLNVLFKMFIGSKYRHFTIQYSISSTKCTRDTVMSYVTQERHGQTTWNKNLHYFTTPPKNNRQSIGSAARLRITGKSYRRSIVRGSNRMLWYLHSYLIYGAGGAEMLVPQTAPAPQTRNTNTSAAAVLNLFQTALHVYTGNSYHTAYLPRSTELTRGPLS